MARETTYCARCNLVGNSWVRINCSVILVAALILVLQISGRSLPAYAAQDNTVKILKPVMPVRGVVRAFAQATISTDLAARVTRVGFKEGEPFRHGDVLIEFDCRKQNAELASARAQHREMMVEYKSAKFLSSRNANSVQDVETARARTDRASAEVDAKSARLDACKIIAPFDGRIVERHVHAHEWPTAGKPLLSIVSNHAPEIELIVPSDWLAWIRAGTAFRLRLDETGEEYSGVVSRLGATVDTVSQTVKVFARFKAPTTEILPGMSGTARFQVQGVQLGWN